MGIDIKDITDILPFILDNLSVSAYIIIISMIFGFFIGKQFEKNRQKERVAELKTKLLNQKEMYIKINTEKEQLEKEIEKISKRCEKSKSRTEVIESEKANSNFASLTALERMFESKEGQIELTALIELNYKKDKADYNKKVDIDGGRNSVPK